MENFDEMYRQRKKEADQKAKKLATELSRNGRSEDAILGAGKAKYKDQLYREFSIG